MELTRNISIVNKIAETVQVTEIIESTAQEAGFAQKDIYDILIAVDEILSNIVYYAYEEGEEGQIEIRMIYSDKSLRLEFIDEGREFNPLIKSDPDLSIPPEEREIGGLGIFIVKKLMDSVVYSREGKRNILKITKTKTGE
ncbi:MAG: ATP-binding protein [Bacteroidetes bacterium]|nr:ATP-binding protein [Bacteroidota bacterium]